MLGMPGAGKSSIGELVAEKMGYAFIDLDLLIEEKERKGHRLILLEDGEEGLLRLEEQYTMELSLDNTVFSPGGSIIYTKAMEKLHRETTIVLLDIKIDALRKRLRGVIEARGIVGLERMTFDQLFEERMPIYRRYAHEVIDATNQKIHETAANVMHVMTSRLDVA